MKQVSVEPPTMWDSGRDPTMIIGSTLKRFTNGGMSSINKSFFGLSIRGRAKWGSRCTGPSPGKCFPQTIVPLSATSSIKAWPARVAAAGEAARVRPRRIDPGVARSSTGPKSVLNPVAWSSRQSRAQATEDEPCLGLLRHSWTESVRKVVEAGPQRRLPDGSRPDAANITARRRSGKSRRAVWSKVSMLRRERTMPPGRIMSSSSRVSRSGSRPWNPRKNN